MSYHALARKWRPHQFSELVGQDHVVRALKHALSEDRLHHALLFSGTRGVGKTTLGRLVSKGLNCESGVTADPCGQCSSCKEIDEGRFVDLIEVDAASRTGVDDTRELLENVQYAPARGRKKVYLIDEVHMLSKSAFNALLKTLEEPPSHVQFLLATTDPQKLPITVLSRCLQFNLKRLPQQEIQKQLEYVLEKENVEFEPAAISLLARAADGSMRDGLSLLDQAIAFGGGQVQSSDVSEMLGSIERGEVLEILRLLAGHDAQPLPELLLKLDEQAPDYALVLDELAASLQQVALLQTVPKALLDDDQQAHRDNYEYLAAEITPEDVQLYYQIAIAGKRDMPFAPNPRMGFEMLLLRMFAFRRALTGEAPVSQAPGGQTAMPSARAAEPATKPAASEEPAASKTEKPEAIVEADMAEMPVKPVASETPKSQTVTAPANSVTFSQLDTKQWPAFVGSLPLRGMAAELARQCAWEGIVEDKLTLKLAPSFENLLGDRYKQQFIEALEEKAGKKIHLSLNIVEHDLPTAANCDAEAQAQRIQQAEQAISDDPNVQALQERFGASIHPGSIEPLS